MGTLKSRVERLERHGEDDAISIVIVGDPTPEQKAVLASGRVRTVFYLPSNGRDHEHVEKSS